MTGSIWRRGLLVSVRDAGEAAVAAAAGAAIIDVKEPDRGPLGRADAATAAAILAAVADRAAVTLACDELVDGTDAILAHLGDVLARLPLNAAGPVAVKAGPAGVAIDAWRDAFLRLADRLPAPIEPVAVAYADCWAVAAPPPESILEAAIAAGASTVLVDTCDKQGPGLFAVVPPERLRAWIDRAAAAGVALALAGRLSASEVRAAAGMGASICGVRSAACEGGRQGRISAPLVRRLGTLVQDARAQPGTAETSWRA